MRVICSTDGLLRLRSNDLTLAHRCRAGGRPHQQSVKTTESGGICGYDAGKKIKGRKRHIITDTLGFLIFVRVHGADIQDRDGAPDLLKAIRFRCLGLATKTGPAPAVS